MKTLFLAWQDPNKRSWHTIGRLTQQEQDGLYQFMYTKGAYEAKRQAQFQPLQSFPNFETIYESKDLFPMFSNRLLTKSRPEYEDYLEWLDVPKHEADPMALLMRSGGRRNTDSFEVFPRPQPNAHGEYQVHFFPHGLRHMPESTLQRIQKLEPGDPLYLTLDVANPVEPFALLLRTNDYHNVGFCPSYLLEDAQNVMWECRSETSVKIERVNTKGAPLQYRLLCKMTSCWPEGFEPCSSERFQPIVCPNVSTS